MARRALALLTVLAAVGLAYARAPWCPWIGGDFEFVLHNPGVVRLADEPSLVLRRADGPHFRPMKIASHALDRALFGESPVGPHAVNLALHLVAVALVFGLARECGAAPAASALGAAAFGLAPRLSDSVLLVDDRGTLLAAVLSLAALLAHLRSRGRPGLRWLAAFLLLLGLLAKELAVAGFLAIVAAEIIAPRPGRWRVAWPRLVPAFVALGLYSALYAVAVYLPPLGHEPAYIVLDDVVPFVDRLFFLLEPLGHYARRLALPLTPEIFPAAAFVDVIDGRGVFFHDGRAVALGALLLVPIGAALRWSLDPSRPAAPRAVAMLGLAALGAVVFRVSLAPAFLACDRWLYLPIAALCAWSAGRVGARRLRRVVAVPMMLALGLCWWRTREQVAIWSDERSMLEATAREAPPTTLYPWLALAAYECEAPDAGRAREVLLEGFTRVAAGERAFGRPKRGTAGLARSIASGEARVECARAPDGRAAVQIAKGRKAIWTASPVPPRSPVPRRSSGSAGGGVDSRRLVRVGSS